jgi:hypothetical protein
MDGNVRQSHFTQIAAHDFERAHRKAFISQLISTLKREPNWLLSFEEVQEKLPLKGQHYRGVQQVLISDIVGSVDRYHDFNRAFMPMQTHTRPRWESVDIAALTDVILPPVQLYKVDNVYFVKDGNHRVSVAKEKGMVYIDADVIEMPTTVSLSPTTDPRDLIKLGEYARFLEQTKLDKLRPGVKIDFSTLGRYDVLIEHISAHRWYMGIDQNRPVEWEEAVLDWYDNVYLPVVHTIRDNDILRGFPGHTEGDLYLWIMDHRWYLREDTGVDVGVQTAALSYDEKYASWTRKVTRSLRRLQEATTRPLVLSAQAIARAIRASVDVVSSGHNDDAAESGVLDQESLARSEGV